MATKETEIKDLSRSDFAVIQNALDKIEAFRRQELGYAFTVICESHNLKLPAVCDFIYSDNKIVGIKHVAEAADEKPLEIVKPVKSLKGVKNGAV